MPATVRLTPKGADVAGSAFDAHVRLEGERLFVDVFDSAVQDARLAHLDSESFPNDNGGRAEAERFLERYGIVALLLA